MNHMRRFSVYLAFGLALLLTMVAFSALSLADSAQVGDQGIVAQSVQTGEAVIKDQNGNRFLAKMSGGNIVAKSEITTGQIIIKYKKNQISAQSSDAITKVTSLYSAQMKSIDDTLRLKVVKIPNEADYLKILAGLKSCPDIEYAEPDYICRTLLTPNDPNYGSQWGPPYIKANEAWDKVSVSQRSMVTIAIVDTGIALSHPDLAGSIVRGYDFVNNDSDPNDDNNHGTHCAGIAAAIVNNGVGIAGIAGGAKLMPVKVLNSSGSGSTSAIVQGMKYAADNGAKVVSMSLGGAGTSSAFQDAVNYVMSKGAVVVAASGNDNGAVSTPGNCNGVITVGSIDKTGARSSFSNYGSSLDVVAPGSSIYSCLRSGYGNMSGTSMATPCVAGVAALLFAVKNSFTPADITRIIQQCATDAGTAGFDNYYGYGIVNASKAVDLAGGGQTPTPTRPGPTPTPGNGTISIAAGSSSAVGSFQADQYYSGGSTYSNTNTVDVSQITSNPPPAALFNNERYGAMSYTIPGFTSGSSYTVTLYFAETYLTSSGSRLFSVSINGATVLSNFDIYASAGGQNKAIARSFTATANSSGQIVIQFIAGTENPKINGISIKPGSGTPTPTNTPTPTRRGPTPTNTPTPTPTRGNNPTPTNTPTPTRGNTPTPTPTPVPGGYVVTYTLSDWGGAANADLTIKNNTANAVNGWTLAWTFPGTQKITNMWNASYTQSGASVSANNLGYNAMIAANGGVVSFGFSMTYSGTNAKPAAFTLNGTACTIQ